MMKKSPAILFFLLFSLQPLAFGLSSNELERLSAGLQCQTLANGLVCITKADDAAPLVSIQVWVGSGSAQEEEYLGGGLSHLIEHMIFKGTPARKPADIAKEIDAAGGSINAYTTLDRTVFWVDMPAEKWLTGLDVLADAVTRASFPEDEWRREKDVIRREMAMNNDNPGRALSKLSWQTAFLAHPYRFPVIGRAEIFNSLGRADLLAFFKRNYVPDNMIVTVVGNVRADEVRAAVERSFSGSGRRARPLLAQPVEPPQLSPRFARQTGAYNISRLEMAWHTVSLSHPAAPALDILAAIAGSGKSARLVQNIREKQKLAFNIDAWSYTPKDAGLFGISASFDPANETALIKAIEDEVAEWRTNALTAEKLAGDSVARHGVARNSADFQDRRTPCDATTNPIPTITYPLPVFTAAEIDKARNTIMAGTLLAFQTMHGQADTFASGWFYAGTPFYFETYLKRLAEVTPESLAAAANRYLRGNNRTIAILSPAITNESVAEVGPEPTPAFGHPSAGGELKKFGNIGIPSLEGCPTGGVGQSSGAVRTNIVKTVFPNGFTLLCREDHRLPFVALSIVSLGGLLLENETNSGVTCLMAELLTRGTQQRSQKQIAEAIEQSGGSLSSFSGLNSFGLQAQCFSKDTELFLDILADCFMNPVFPDAEVKKCKNIQAARINEQHESPVFLAQEAMRQALFAGHPYSLNVEGTRVSVMALSREELGRLHERTAVGSNTVLAVFGDITPEKARAMAEKYFGRMPAGKRMEWRSVGAAERSSALQKDCSAPRCGAGSSEKGWPARIVLTSPREQAVVLMGFPGITVTDQRIDALAMALQALNGLSSDLMINVRDKKGLAYYTGAYHKAGLAGGQFVVYAGTRAEETGRVAETIKKEIVRLAGKGVRADEFERAKQQIISEYRQSLQVNSGLALECALDEIYGLGFARALSAEQRVGQLAPEDVRRAAAEIMRGEMMVEVIVRPECIIRP